MTADPLLLVLALALAAVLAVLLWRARRQLAAQQAALAAAQATREQAEREALLQGAEAAQWAQRQRETLAELTALRAQAQHQGQTQAEENARLLERVAQQQRAFEAQQSLLEQARTQLADAFKGLSAEALKANSESFLTLARESLLRFQQGAQQDLGERHKAIEALTRPIQERLAQFDGKLGELERARVGAYEALSQQVRGLVESDLPRLHAETASLVKALRQPSARGRWGEVQLKRVVEMAGMLEHCDFDEQVSQDGDEGRQRPDLVVRLPGGRQIVVDAKAPLDAYLGAVEARDETAREALLQRHAQQVRAHISQLSRKAYFEQFDPSPEFVVLFVPGEAFFSAALAQDPELIEFGAESRVIPASPTTLIALLKAVAYGWRQEALARNAQAISALGRELHERLRKLAEHWNKVGRGLDAAVKSYNEATGSLESRVLVSARRFQDLRAASGEELASAEPVERLAKQWRLDPAAEALPEPAAEPTARGEVP
ncbi:MAG TPA: DNA recombination protein RmuC [Nevskiaceae bacterium]|nr:DNA recombination protein RmuC [Nevskiaceae bacterium]